MNINTNRKLMLAAAVVIMLNFNSCGKYEDGPKFSLKSKTSRLVGEWEVIKIDNDKFTDESLYLEFEKDGDFSLTYEYDYDGTTERYTYDGDWEWDSKKEVIEMKFDDNDLDKLDFEVKRLSKDELWFESDDGDYKQDWECEKVD